MARVQINNGEACEIVRRHRLPNESEAGAAARIILDWNGFQKGLRVSGVVDEHGIVKPKPIRQTS